MFKKSLKKALALSLAVALAFSGAQIAGIGGAGTALAAANDLLTTTAKIDSTTAANAGYLMGTTHSAAKQEGFLYVKPGASAIIKVGIDSATALTPKVLLAPTGWTVTANDVEAGDANVIITATAPSTAATTDLNAGANLVVQIKNARFEVFATNSNYTKGISGKDSVNLSTSEGAVALNAFKTKAEIAGFNDNKWSADAALQDCVTLYDTSEAKAFTSFSDVTWADNDTIAAKAAKAGQSGVFTFKNDKGKVSFTADSEGLVKDVDVLASSKAVKVNVLSEAVANTGTTIAVDNTANRTLPFKALISSSTDITAQEVDSEGKVLASESGKITIDNTAKTVTYKSGATGNAYVKFVPKDSVKSGTGIQFTITDGGAGTGNDAILPSSCALAANGNSGTLTDASGIATCATGDKVSFRMADDNMDSLITAKFYSAYTDESTNTALDPEDDENGYGVVYAKTGTPAGTYKAYVTTYDANTHSLKWSTVNVVITGESKDSNIKIEKVNGKALATPATNATILSGTDVTFDLTSDIKKAGTVSDLAVASAYLEEVGTGARIVNGVTFTGMTVTLPAAQNIAGKSYKIYVTTNGSNISESNAQALTITVQQGYAFNYNLEGGIVIAGKTLTPVAVASTTAQADAKLEDGSNIEYVGATFLGWSYTQGATTADIKASEAKAGLTTAQIKKALDKQVDGTVNVYAVWDFATYTMNYNANGGTGDAKSVTFNVKATDMVLPSEGFTNGNKPLIGWTTTSTGKTPAGGSLPVYTGTLNGPQLQTIISEVDPTAKTANITLYAQYGAALTSVEITPATLSLTAEGATGLVSATAKDETGAVMTTPVITFTSDNTGVASVDANGIVTPVAEGTANIKATAKLGNVEVTSPTACVVTVGAKVLKPNTLTVKGKTATVKTQKKGVKKLTKKQTLAVSKVLTIKDAQGTVTFKKSKGNAKITIAKKTGKVTLKKGLKVGTYSVKVKVTASGNDDYKAKTVTRTFKIVVKKK